MCVPRPRGGAGGEGGAGGGGGGSKCKWSRTFSSPPVVLYRVETSTGRQQQLDFTPRAG